MDANNRTVAALATPQSLPLDFKAEAVSGTANTLNQDLLLSLTAALMNNPEVDLMSLVPPSYISQMDGPLQPRKSGSKLAMYNQQTFINLLSCFQNDPNCSLVSKTSTLEYRRRRESYLNINKKPKRSTWEEDQPEPFFSSIESVKATSLDVVFPLSSSVSTLLERAQASHLLPSPVEALKYIIRESECLWEGGFGNFVARLSDELAVKITSRSQTNHHLALQHLVEVAPDVPAPRPHGLVQLEKRSLLFMSHLPGRSLDKVWTTLSHEEKVSIQEQLDRVFIKVRSIKQDNRPLGTIDGQGVQDSRGAFDNFRSDEPILTAAAFEDWYFSCRPYVTDAYIRFLKTLLPASRLEKDCVFTHCDVRPANIMVCVNESGDWVVSGVLDWEEAGFYPAYWESAKSTRTLLANQTSDWYQYLPKGVAPSSFAKEWLIDRNWEFMIQYLKAWEPRAKKSNHATCKLRWTDSIEEPFPSPNFQRPLRVNVAGCRPDTRMLNSLRLW